MRKSKNAGKIGRNPVTGKIFSILDRKGLGFSLHSTWQTRIGAEKHRESGQLVFSETAIVNRILNFTQLQAEYRKTAANLKADHQLVKTQLAAANKLGDNDAATQLQEKLDLLNRALSAHSEQPFPDLESFEEILQSLKKM